MHQAYLYEKDKNKNVRCKLCNHFCLIAEGGKGICGVRINKEGELFTLVYKKIIAENIDPIEKKPFYHFIPGSRSYSIATLGCNFRCDFCQNYGISSVSNKPDDVFDTTEINIEDIVNSALKHKCKSISYTYTEPTIFFEMAYDTCRIAKENGLKNVFVTNGYMTPDALNMVAPYLDAANVDLKGDENFYKNLCKAHFQPVVNTIRQMRKLGIWVEVTTLIIPGYNDDKETFDLLAEKLYEIDPDMPWHFSRFFPVFKMSDHHPTEIEIVHNFREKAIKYGFKYVYAGNIPGNYGGTTFCPKCEKPAIKRIGYTILEDNTKSGTCNKCGFKLAGIFK